MGLNREIKGGPPFQPGEWWIDDRGLEHKGESFGFFTENWFLQTLGQVKVALKPVLVEVTWDSGQVHELALETIKCYLAEMDLDATIRLSFYYHGWSHEIFRDSLSAMERIDEIQECKSVGFVHETRIKSCPLSDIYYSGSRIKRGYQSWERAAGRFTKVDQSDVATIMPHALMFRLDKSEENLVFSWVGMKSTSAKVYGPEWVKESIGKVCQRSFGAESQGHADMVSVDIAKTLQTGEPVYQHIRALMRIEGQEPFWVPYERLLTRYTLRGGRPAVVCDVRPTQYIDVSLAGSP